MSMSTESYTRHTCIIDMVSSCGHKIYSKAIFVDTLRENKKRKITMEFHFMQL